jgi:hypothetical protein
MTFREFKQLTDAARIPVERTPWLDDRSVPAMLTAPTDSLASILALQYFQRVDIPGNVVTRDNNFRNKTEKSPRSDTLRYNVTYC